MPLHVQAYLQEHSLESLTEHYFIKATRHKEFPELVSLKYNQIDSPMESPIVQECRGLILDSARNWEIVARPFDKFFNYGEAYAAVIDWNSARTYEKLDGTLIIMYWYNGEWRVATTGTADASGPVPFNPSINFAELFWYVYSSHSYPLPGDGSKSHTFLFELTTPYNKVVVQHKDSSITFLGARNNLIGNEYHPEELNKMYGWPAAQRYDLRNIADIQTAAAALNPVQQEGYVVVDKEFRRVKVKSPAYVALHHMTGGITPRQILEIIRKGEQDEWLSYFPEYKDLFDDVSVRYFRLWQGCMNLYHTHKDVVDQKEFAHLVLPYQYSSIVFQMRRNNDPYPDKYLAQLTIKQLEKLLPRA